MKSWTTVSSSMSALLCGVIGSCRGVGGDCYEQRPQQAAVRLHRFDEFVFLVDGSHPFLQSRGLDEVECALFPFLVAGEPAVHAVLNAVPAGVDDLDDALGHCVDRCWDEGLVGARVDWAWVAAGAAQA